MFKTVPTIMEMMDKTSSDIAHLSGKLDSLATRVDGLADKLDNLATALVCVSVVFAAFAVWAVISIRRARHV